MTQAGDIRLIVVAQIAGAFGVKGEVKVRSYTEDPEACFSYGPLLNEAGEVVLTPVRFRPLKDVFGVIAKEPLQREGWDALKGVFLHVPREAMPDTENEDEYYVVDLVGCRVVHSDGRELGVLQDVVNFGAGDLFDIACEKAVGGRFYLPYDDVIEPDVDLDARVITVAPDESYVPEQLQRQSEDGGTN